MRIYARLLGPQTVPSRRITRRAWLRRFLSVSLQRGSLVRNISAKGVSKGSGVFFEPSLFQSVRWCHGDGARDNLDGTGPQRHQISNHVVRKSFPFQLPLNVKEKENLSRVLTSLTLLALANLPTSVLFYNKVRARPRRRASDRKQHPVRISLTGLHLCERYYYGCNVPVVFYLNMCFWLSLYYGNSESPWNVHFFN